MNEDRGSSFIAFMCKTAFGYDARDASDGARIYPSAAALRREYKCLDECGVVSVTVTLLEVIQEENWK